MSTDKRTIPRARYAFVVKEGAAGEPRIVLDLKAAPDLAVLGDGRLGLELARPEIARELASRLNAAVHLVGYERRPEPLSTPRGPMPRAQHARYRFRPCRGDDVGAQWVAALLLDEGLPILAGGYIGL
ncbi:MAG TPA: hypothetical protein VK132_04420, partial [Gemmatimonadales bacterium]|nr:hypothetical protein [Gemmatimonadales bacterium]